MKTIAIVMSVNNPDMFTQADLDKYQTEECYFKLYYADTDLREINTEKEGQAVLPLTVKKIQQAEQEGASAALVFVFCDVGICEAKQVVSIPVLGMGKMAVQLANEICREKFTILPGKLAHNGFISDMINSMELEANFQLANHEVGLLPSEIRKDPEVLEKLFLTACAEIDRGVDTLSMGCSCFIGLAKPLQERLRAHYQTNKINVVDSAEVTLNLARLL